MDIFVHHVRMGTLFLLLSCVSAVASITVSTTIGNVTGFNGYIQLEGQAKTLTRFLGIPYAEPPVGNNRFAKPIPKAPLNATYIANAYPPSCFQQFSRDNLSEPYTEDCLFLSIYIPTEIKNDLSLPVMIWIHGGAFISGTSSQYKADALSVFGNVIVVTINYRLGMFGFLRCSDGTLAGNQGLWDQQLAIRWIHDNIRSFGGVPEQITIFGESAGSISAMYQSIYAGNKGLFTRVIGESGSALTLWHTVPTSNAEEFATAAGCFEKSCDDIVNCLRAKSANELLSVVSNTIFQPIVDGEFVVEWPYDIVYGNNTVSAASREMFGSVDILTGVCEFDGAFYLIAQWMNILHAKSIVNFTITRQDFENVVIPIITSRVVQPKTANSRISIESWLEYVYTDWSDPDNTTAMSQMVVNMSSDSSFFQSAMLTINGHTSMSRGRTYFYEFAARPSYHLLPTPPWLTGSNHADDIPFVFGEPVSNVSSTRTTFISSEQLLSVAIMTWWTNFAKTSDPNIPNHLPSNINISWPQYDVMSQKFLRISDTLGSSSVLQRFLPERMELWLNLIPDLLKLT